MIIVNPPDREQDVYSEEDYIILVKRNKNAEPEIVCSVDSMGKGRLVAKKLTDTVLDGFRQNGLRYICVPKSSLVIRNEVKS